MRIVWINEHSGNFPTCFYSTFQKFWGIWWRNLLWSPAKTCRKLEEKNSWDMLKSCRNLSCVTFFAFNLNILQKFLRVSFGLHAFQQNIKLIMLDGILHISMYFLVQTLWIIFTESSQIIFRNFLHAWRTLSTEVMCYDAVKQLWMGNFSLEAEEIFHDGLGKRRKGEFSGNFNDARLKGKELYQFP
jgi:hypothetical protein